MKTITLLFISLATIFGTLDAFEHFDLKAPKDWTPEVQQYKEGKLFEVWFNADHEERLVNVSAPLEKDDTFTIQEAVQAIVLPLQTYGVQHDSVINGNQALISWAEDDNVAVVKMLLSETAFHSLSFFYKGGHPENIDISFWKCFIQNTQLVK